MLEVEPVPDSVSGTDDPAGTADTGVRPVTALLAAHQAPTLPLGTALRLMPPPVAEAFADHVGVPVPSVGAAGGTTVTDTFALFVVLPWMSVALYWNVSSPENAFVVAVQSVGV
jgi:hypothetical protein